MLDDSPVAFSIPGQPLYTPKNYDGQFKGRVSLRTALAESRNIPAVKVLASYGVSKMIEVGQKMGITTWNDQSRFGISLTLGGGEVKLIELAQVFATIANYGKRPEITPILQVKDYQGKILFQPEAKEQEKVVDSRVAYQLIDILKDNIARSGEFGLASYLVIKNHPEVAVKTGTSNDLRDNLTVGFNQEYLVAVWVGNNDNSPMSRIASGITGASPIWNKIMSALLNNKAPLGWKVPEKLVKTYDCLSGHEDWFLEEARPTKPCSQVTPAPTIVPGPQVLGTEDR
jgi:membrane carboxypeptidase/penicillin-binding protein PbpC